MPHEGGWEVGTSASGEPAAAAGAVVEPAVEPLLAGLGEGRTVLVAGASGFVGGHLLARLRQRGHRVRALSRRDAASGRGARAADGVEWVTADLTDPASLRGVASGCQVVVHLAGIASEARGQSFRAVHVEGTEHLLEEATRAGVARVVLVSAMGARPDGSGFFRTKWEAERRVRSSGLEHVIFRPSVVYGPDDHFTSALVRLLERLPVFPLLGGAGLRLQPVAVEDVSDALVQAVERSELEGTFELAGPEALKLAKIVRIVAGALKLRRPIVQLPAGVAGPVLRLADRLGLPSPLTPDQLGLLREAGLLRREDNALRTVFQVEPLPFRVAIEDYL